VPIRGSDFDRWDLQINGGTLGSARVFVAVEPHGSGRELLRIQCRPMCSPSGLGLTMIFALLGYAAAQNGAWGVYVVFGGTVLLILTRACYECARATGAFLAAVRKIKRIERKSRSVT
jgi:hypothetical protein